MTTVMTRREDDPAVQARLRAMLRTVVDRMGGNQGAAGRHLGVSQSLVLQALAGHKTIKAELAIALAADVGESLDALYEVGPHRWGDADGFMSALAMARALFPNVRTAAWERVADLRGECPPTWDAAKLGLLASMFDGPIARG
jgi:hypothetical protein